MIGSVLSTGVAGVQKGIIDMHEAADKITKAGTVNAEDDVGDIAQSLVDLKLSRNQVEVSARVIETASEVMGTLIDIKA